MKTKLSRFDLEEIIGEAIQIRHQNWAGCVDWIIARMACKLHCSEESIVDNEKLITVAHCLGDVAKAFDEVAKELYLPEVTPVGEVGEV